MTLTIDDQAATVDSGTTILQAAQRLGITIPTICYHEATTANALCRLCVVEMQGARTLVPACVGTVSAGMVVSTHSERVLRACRTILEMLASAVDLSEAPDIQALLPEYQVNQRRFPEAKRRTWPVLDDNPMYIRDYAKRVLFCGQCLGVCPTNALKPRREWQLE